MVTLHIVRGAPGSGKSTFAATLECPVVEADQFFMVGDQYCFDAAKLPAAHEWCLKKTCDLLSQALCNTYGMQDGGDVAVANTFTKFEQMAPYLEYCNEWHIDYRVYEVTGQFTNTHGCPDERVAEMRAEFERWPNATIISPVDRMMTIEFTTEWKYPMKITKQVLKALLVAGGVVITPAEAMPYGGSHHWWFRQGQMHCYGSGPGWEEQTDETSLDLDAAAATLFHRKGKRFMRSCPFDMCEWTDLDEELARKKPGVFLSWFFAPPTGTKFRGIETMEMLK